MKRFFAASILSAGLLLSASGAVFAEGGDVIKEGKQVSFDYTLTVDGKVVDSSKGLEPLKYTHGKGEIIPGLSKRMEGMKVGEEKAIAVTPEEAYGMVNPTAFREVPRASLPKDMEPKVGMMLQAASPDGQSFPARISEVKKETVVVDFNHPLAGKTLNFQVKVASIQ